MHANTHPVMLFAAGFGTRMGDLTKDQPKPLIEVAGRPLIDHALDLVRETGTEVIVANVHYKAKMLETYLQGTGVQTVHEDPDILDTGGGLRNALPVLGDAPVITTNTDAVWFGPNPISLLAEAWDPMKMDALLICVPTAQARGHSGDGDFGIEEDGKLYRGGDMIYGGVQILKTDLLHDVPDARFSLNVVWNQMASSSRLFGLSSPGQWCDVGHPGGIIDAEKMLEQTNV